MKAKKFTSLRCSAILAVVFACGLMVAPSQGGMTPVYLELYGGSTDVTNVLNANFYDWDDGFNASGGEGSPVYTTGIEGRVSLGLNTSYDDRLGRAIYDTTPDTTATDTFSNILYSVDVQFDDDAYSGGIGDQYFAMMFNIGPDRDDALMFTLKNPAAGGSAWSLQSGSALTNDFANLTQLGSNGGTFANNFTYDAWYQVELKLTNGGTAGNEYLDLTATITDVTSDTFFETITLTNLAYATDLNGAAMSGEIGILGDNDYHSKNSIKWDNFSVQEVPEPSTLLLFATLAVFVGLAKIGRRR